MLVAWVLFPLVLLAVCLGCGLLVERIAGFALSGRLLASLGLALVIVVASLTTDSSSIARYTTAVVVALAVGGYASSWRRVRALRPDRWSLGVGLAIYLIAAAPVVLSGSAAFLGYFTLNDAAVHFALIDQLLSHGHDLSHVASSSYAALLHSYISTGYPIGSQVALGAVRPLVGEDVAWIFQPFMAVIVALGAVALYELLEGVVRPRSLQALCAFIAAQPGLLYAFYLEASVKELATAWIITVTVVLVFVTVRRQAGVRRVFPLVVAVAAGLDILKLAIVPWLALPVATAAVLLGWQWRHAVRRASPKRVAVVLGGVAAATFALAAPVLGSASTFLNVANAVLTAPNDLGNLAGPLQKWELFGIWPSGDFRFGPVKNIRATYALIGIAAASAVFGVLWLWRRRSFAPLLLIAGNSIAVIYLLSRASPYASAKVMAIYSVSVVLSAMLGAAALHDSGRRIEGWGLALVVAGGVLWTNAIGYHDSSVAPRGRLSELSSIDNRFAGQGPSFDNLSEEFAAHFLRRTDPVDVALSPPPARAGVARTVAQVRLPWDPDELAFSYLEQFPLLVLGRSPVSSRPPSNYQLAYEGSYYQVWKRTTSPEVLTHYPLGSELSSAAVPACAAVKKLAKLAAARHARLAYVVRSPSPALVPTLATRPPNWGEIDGDPDGLIPREGSGVVSGAIAVPQSGRYQVWLEGSFGHRMDVALNGRHVGSVEYELGPPGQFVSLGEVTLAKGAVAVTVSGPTNNLRPGYEGGDRILGPLVLTPSSLPTAVAEIDPARAASLCGRLLDWIEIVR